jgi:putative flippase GtrA
MEHLLLRVLGDRLGALAVQFMRFGLVGAAGFMVDTGVVYALRGMIGIYAAGAVAYLFAASFTWFFNRLWAFRNATHQPPGRQWAIFLATQSIGFLVNRGVFATLVTTSALCAEHPVIATFAGMLAGMFLNFGFARRYVFRT